MFRFILCAAFQCFCALTIGFCLHHMILWYSFGTNAAFRVQSGSGGVCVYVLTLNKSGYVRMHMWVFEVEIIRQIKRMLVKKKRKKDYSSQFKIALVHRSNHI